MHARLVEEPRRVPRQRRGELRVAQLLRSAAAVIAESGYEAATMSAIALRADAPIGSLYQFFPNKEAVAQALWAEYGNDYESLLILLAAHAKHLSLHTLVGRLITLTVRFVESHPAFLPLLDAPPSKKRRLVLRRTLRGRLADCLAPLCPGLPRSTVLRLAAVSLQVLKGLNQLYAEAPRRGGQYVREYKVVLCSYLSARLEQGRRDVAG